MSETIKIVALCVAAAVLYGVIHNQITARVCVEYFTIAHPRLIVSQDPATLGLFWGVVSTWWVGLALGALLTAAARYGQMPKRTARSLLGVVGTLLLAMAALAGLAGLTAWALADVGWLVLTEPWASRVPPDHHRAFVAVGAAHGMSYVAGGLGGALQAWRVWHARPKARS